MMLATTVLSAGSGNSTINDVEPGLLGFLVVAFIAIALVFLVRSMNKQFRKLPPPEDQPEDRETGPGGTGEEEHADANNPEDARRG